MKKTGGYVGVIFGGIILIWFLFINLPRVIEQLSSYNSSNPHGVAAIAGVLVGNILILIAGITILRSGMKKLKGNEEENINDKIESDDVEDSDIGSSSIKNTDEEIILKDYDKNLDLKNEQQSGRDTFSFQPFVFNPV